MSAHSKSARLKVAPGQQSPNPAEPPVSVAPEPAPSHSPSPQVPWRVGLKAIIESPIFWAALALKLALGITLSSHYLTDLFVPFLNYFVESGFKNPWSYFGGIEHWNAFPYPPVMLVLLAIPRTLLSFAMPSGTYEVTAAHLFAMRLPLLVADLGLCLMLLRWFPQRVRRVLLLYWASPISLYICYWHGQLDILPTAIFVASLHFIQDKRYRLGMAVFGLGLATKSHLLFVLPFLAFYLWQTAGKRETLKALGGFALTYAACLLPVAFDPAFRKMVFGSAEQMRLFALQVGFGANRASILVAPLAIMTLFFRFTAYPKWNWDLFFSYLGVLFCVFVLLIPPAPGYFLWSFPFIVYFLCRNPRPSNLALFGAYSAAFVGYEVLGLYWPIGSSNTATVATNLTFTLMEASLAGITMHMYMFGIRSNSVYSLRTTPLMVGLAGDSGSGKDTFVQLLSDLLGKKRVTVTNGDDYHRWPRGHQKWKVFTHLDVRANDIYREHEHAITLASGGRVLRGEYDHGTGQFTDAKPVDPNGVLIFSGLHSLSLKSLRHLYDLKVFLDPDEKLRHYWKISRDCKERGYSAKQVKEALARRKGDAEKYVLPQRNLADVVVRTTVAPGGDEEEFGVKLKLEISAQNSFNLIGVAERLSAVQTLKVFHDPFQDADWQRLDVSGDINAGVLRNIAAEAITNYNELAPEAKFHDGLNGCLQLVFLSCLSDQLRWHNKEVKAA